MLPKHMTGLLQLFRHWTWESHSAPGGGRSPAGADPSVIRLPGATPRLLLGLLACYPVLILLGYLLLPGNKGPAAIWPADAALVLAFLASPTRLWAPIAVVATAVDFGCGPVANWLAVGQWMDWHASLGYALSHCATDLGPVLAARFMQRMAGFDPQLVESPAWLLVVVLGVIPGAVLGMVEFSSRVAVAPSLPAVTVWTLSTSLAILLFAPALAIAFQDRRDTRDGAPGTVPEALVLAALCAAIVAWHERTRSPGLAQLPTLLLLVFPVCWLALRFSRRVVFIAVPAIAYLLAWLGARGPDEPGPALPPSAWPMLVVGSQLSLLGICGAALLVSHIVHSQRRLLAALSRERARLRWYASELERTEEDARQRIAGELHDGIAQVLTGQSLLLGAVQPSVTDADAADLLAGAVDAAAEAQRHVRALIQDLSPIELEARNLHDLVQRSAAAFSARYPFRIELGELPSNELPAPTLRLLFRALRELLFNAYHHSGGTHVRVAGRVALGWVTLEVRDDGIGFSKDSIGRREGSGGLGLIQLHERVESVGGNVELGRRDGTGGLVTVTVPEHLREPAAPEP